VSDNTISSAAHGFELRRPNAQWKMPNHVDGPAAVLELARQDYAAVVVVRIHRPRPGETLEKFVADQTMLASVNLEITRPTPQPTTLGGQAAIELSYEGKILSGQLARCTLVYVPVRGAILSVALISAAGADPSAARELAEIRESVKVAAPPARPPAATGSPSTPTFSW
jgi:hypothetical protein